MSKLELPNFVRNALAYMAHLLLQGMTHLLMSKLAIAAKGYSSKHVYAVYVLWVGLTLTLLVWITRLFIL